MSSSWLISTTLLGFCTGQVCDTNNNNELKAEPNLPWKTLPYVSHSPFHEGIAKPSLSWFLWSFSEFGKGFELKCPDTKNEFLDTNGIPSRTPLILSPITGKRYGRFRLKSDHPSACLNDGVFVIGSEDWEGKIKCWLVISVRFVAAN